MEAFQKNLMDHNGPLATISPGFLVHIPTTWTGPDWAGVVALCYEMMLWSQLCQVNLAAHLLLLLSSLFKWKVKCAGHIIVYSAEAELASCFVDSETYTVLWRIWNLTFLVLVFNCKVKCAGHMFVCLFKGRMAPLPDESNLYLQNSLDY